MKTTDTNTPSTFLEEDMSLQMGATALGLLGLISLDDQTHQALIAIVRRLSELDAREPQLGIRKQVQEALQSEDPVAAIKRVLDQYRDQLIG